MKIRNAIKSDILPIKKLIEELEDIQINSTLFKEIYEEYLTRSNAYIWVLENDNIVIGFLSCFGQRLLHHINFVFEIQEFIITKSFQNKGFGKMMIERLIKELKPLGIYSLEVTTNKKRLATQKFYGAVGFLNSHEKFTNSKSFLSF